VGYNNPASAAFTFVADMQLTNEVWVKWEAAVLFATANCNSVNLFLWPLIYDSRLLERVLSIRQVAWDVPETNPSFHTFSTYCIEKKDGRKVFSQACKTAQCIAKALIATRLPHLAEAAEVAAFLPTAVAQFPDLGFQFASCASPLSLICSLCARSLGAKHQASTYAKAELTGNLNPLKQTLAQMALAAAECLEKEWNNE
jgi:hypothetical protein